MPDPTSAAHATPTVLVVEDNPAMRALIRALVEQVASEVHECVTAEEALELYPRLNPDWVLMDIRLGGLDGIEATRQLVRLDPGARVIIVTEHGDRGYREAADAAGARDFVLKENLLDLTSLLDLGPGDDE